MSNVTIRNLNKNYENGFHAVKDVNLEIRDKEFVVLVGPSGCGKTTTLRMVAGLEEITSGEILIGTRLINDLPPMDRDIAMVFQNYALYPHKSVYQNMAFGLQMRKYPKDEIEKRVRATKSYEVNIRLDDGSRRVVREANLPAWRAGDRVRVVDGTIRANG